MTDDNSTAHICPAHTQRTSENSSGLCWAGQWAVVFANKALTEEAGRPGRHHSLVWSPDHLSWIRGHC